MKNIVDLIEADGGTLKKVAGTNGGEFSGPCPWCQGEDRFRIWPGEGRYWCRNCGKAGDSIQYLRERRGLSFVEACKVLGEARPPMASAKPTYQEKTWTPRELKTPADLWQVQAALYNEAFMDALWSNQGNETRQWLHDVKGLNDETIRAAELGLNITDRYPDREEWGLDPVIKDDGTAKRQWLPSGLTIPLIDGDAIHRLRIRRIEPGDGSRYIIVSGSSSAPTILNLDRAVVVVVESEIDAILLDQDAGDLVTSISIGSACSKPDINTHMILIQATIILIALDNDEAEARASQWWLHQYPQAKRWPTVGGKDPSEAWANGLDIRQWIITGIFGSESRFERFCIMTIDGELSDNEALRQ